MAYSIRFHVKDTVTTGRQVRRTADVTAPPGLASRQCAAGRDEPAKHSLLHGSVAPEFRVLLLRGTIRALQIHRVCASTACRIDHLPSIIIRTDEFS